MDNRIFSMGLDPKVRETLHHGTSSPSAQTHPAAATPGPSDQVTLSNAVQPQIGSAPIFSSINQLITSAKKSVIVEMYAFQSSKTDPNSPPVAGAPGSADQQKIADNLIAAAKRGVDVRVILDASRSSGSGSAHNASMLKYLKANGVQVLQYPPDQAAIDHVKLLVVDGEQALIGGMNWSNHSPANHDADVLVSGAGASEIQQSVFEPDWLLSGGSAPKSPVPAGDDPTLTVVNSRPADKEQTIKDHILQMVQGAKTSVYGELNQLTDRQVIQALIAGHQRGVDVKIMLDPNQQPNANAFATLQKAGVPVKWYKVDQATREMMHAKWAVADSQRLLIGSANWTGRGLNNTITFTDPKTGAPKTVVGNREAGVVVDQAAPAAAFQAQFAQDWAQHTMDTLPPGFKTNPPTEW